MKVRMKVKHVIILFIAYFIGIGYITEYMLQIEPINALHAFIYDPKVHILGPFILTALMPPLILTIIIICGTLLEYIVNTWNTKI